MNTDKHLCIIGQRESKTNIKLIDEAKRKFESVFFVPIDAIHIGLTDTFSITYRTTNLLKFKAVFPRISKPLSSYSYQLLSLFPEDTFMPIKPISFLLACERFFLLTVLRKREIDTINLRLTYKTESALRIIEGNNFPLIIRTPEKKTGVVVENVSEAKTIIDAFVALQHPILIEDIVKDMVSIYVAEPDVIAAVKKRTKEKDIVFGKGEIKKFKLDLEVKQLALEAARAIDAQIARVDLTLSDSPKVVNIELNPKLIVPSEVTGENLPKLVMQSVYENYKKHLERPVLMKFFDDAKSVVKDVLKGKQLVF
jgi:glutathione synthase/RimK-type ligase-like ATP-grasp enzyme